MAPTAVSNTYNAWSVVYGETPSAAKWNYLGTNDARFVEILDNLLSGWIDPEETWTYASSTTFTVSGDVTSKYRKGTKIRLTQTSVKYFVVTDVTYGAPNTTVTVTAGDDYTIANAAITDNFYSYDSCPQGYPSYFNYDNFTVTLDAGNLVSSGSKNGWFSVNGNIVNYGVFFVQAKNGTQSLEIQASLPITAASVAVQGTGGSHGGGSADNIFPAVTYITTTTKLAIRCNTLQNLSMDGVSRGAAGSVNYPMA